MGVSAVVEAFAADVGGTEPVVAVGGRGAFELGGAVDDEAREVVAPAGIVDFVPAEMTVCAYAGTEVETLQAALADHGQCVAFPASSGSTIGGALSVGLSDHRRLGRGPIRETLLQARYVSADGTVVTAGGPTVKNVSGFDLCRLLVGSLGTIGLLAEVILRTRPLPAETMWMRGDVDPWLVRERLLAPASVLWDGTTTWALLEGYATDVEAETEILEAEGMAAAGPPDLPEHRWSIPPQDVGRLDGSFVAEVGVGVVHRDEPQPPKTVEPMVAELCRRIKDNFDPTGRLAPGRTLIPGAS